MGRSRARRSSDRPTAFVPRLAGLVLLFGPAACGARSALEEPHHETERCAPDREADNPLGIVALSLGTHHSCAIAPDRTVRCWGKNEHGQLGDGSQVDRATPVTVSGLTDVVQISADTSITCALRSDASVWCWGRMRPDRSSPPADMPSPRLLPELGPAVQVVAIDDWSACAVRADGRIACTESPHQFDGIDDTIKVVDNGGSIVCVRSADRTVRCYANYLDPEASGLVRTPELDDALEIRAGISHVCARMPDESLRCFGSSAFGQSGPDPGPGPQGGPEVPCGREIALGDSHSCRATSDRHLWCWGDDSFGQLGRVVTPALAGTFDPSAAAVEGIGDVAFFALGGGLPDVGGYTCAVGEAGLWCWGGNDSGQLGDGTNESRVEPRAVAW